MAADEYSRATRYDVPAGVKQAAAAVKGKPLPAPPKRRTASS